MFDIGFSELFVVAIVALLVLGPERLPKAARYAGLWARRARAQWQSVKSEWEGELAGDDLKRSLRETREQLEEAKESLRNTGRTLQGELESAREEIRQLDSGHAAPARHRPSAVPPIAGSPGAADAQGREPDPGAPATGEPDVRAPDHDEDAPPHGAEAGAAAPAADAGFEREEDARAAEWRERRRRELDRIDEEIERAMQAPEDGNGAHGDTSGNHDRR